MKYIEINDFIKNIKETNLTLDSLIDISKINLNIENIRMDLYQLNYIISNNEEEIIKKIKLLWEKDKFCFKVIINLVGIKDINKKFILNNKIYKFDEFINSLENIILFFKETGLINLIIKNKITSFVDYFVGLEVGMDTNARKNRTGIRIENNLYERLINLFKNRKEIIIEKQKKINFTNDEILNAKVFDILITNKETNKCVLIESSFYNTSGSKINETAKSYLEINNRLKEYESYKFLWLADGEGLKSVKKILIGIIKYDFLTNEHDLFEEINELI